MPRNAQQQQQMSTELVHVPFHGDSLDVITEDGTPWVAVLPICGTLGLSFSRQRKKLQDREWATVALKATVAEDGKSREMFCIDLDSIPMWLATVEPSRVAEHIRPKLIRYQRECARVLRDHFMGPTSPAPPVPMPTLIGMPPEVAAGLAQLPLLMQRHEQRVAELQQENSELRQELDAYTRTVADVPSLASELRSALRELAEAEGRPFSTAEGRYRLYAGLPGYRRTRLADVRKAIEKIREWTEEASRIFPRPRERPLIEQLFELLDREAGTDEPITG